MSTHFHIVIPARFQSSRLPGKLLLDLKGKTVIERVYRQAILAGAESVTIATDHPKIFAACEQFNAAVIMTNSTHQSGTDRIAEVVKTLGLAPDEIIVNVQGDEPFIQPALIQQVAKSLTTTDAPMATLCWPIEQHEMYKNPNVVKVVRDCHEHALYFSRSPIPMHRDTESTQGVFGHIGLYAYRARFLLEYVTWPVCILEKAEALEQLRVLWSGHKIKVETACVCPLQDINTQEDFERALLQLA